MVLTYSFGNTGFFGSIPNFPHPRPTERTCAEFSVRMESAHLTPAPSPSGEGGAFMRRNAQAASSKAMDTRRPNGFKISCNVASVGLPCLERIL